MHTVTDAVTLWLDGGVPTRMIWRGARWRVTDTPTELFRDVGSLPEVITHPPAVRIGWRFQAADSTGLNRVFDVRRDGLGWMLEHVYE
ncbi:hypothetical protein [Microterricola viridarii]|uniref:hypothetical protein n=1 Tax=Microterricola viridarii TaxID=412690 RepID=UPI0009E96A79|nr:hypothetical protein [Microterricola viridarii]